MKKVIRLSLVLILSPLLVLASGQQMLSLVFVQFFAILLFIVLIIGIKAALKDKLWIMAIYTIALSLTLFVLNDLPFLDYSNFITLASIAVPFLLSFSFYFLKVKKTNRRANS